MTDLEPSLPFNNHSLCPEQISTIDQDRPDILRLADSSVITALTREDPPPTHLYTAREYIISHTIYLSLYTSISYHILCIYASLFTTVYHIICYMLHIYTSFFTPVHHIIYYIYFSSYNSISYYYYTIYTLHYTPIKLTAAPTFHRLVRALWYILRVVIGIVD